MVDEKSVIHPTQLVTGNTAFILQGAILIGLLAVAVDSLFEQLQRRAPGTSQAK